MRTFDDAARVLGELEQRVMELLWDVGPLAVRQVQRRIGGGLAYTTVMTTLDRLFKKGLLARTKAGLAFVYRPALDRAEYQRRVVEAALGPLLERGSGPVLAAFVDVAADLSEAHLRQLEELIAARRRRR
ncbi:MAG: BlaI/MecI/CopY family transcriptional regulator [Kofleriaceae bacterium]|jgi:predicted transcriptional regulator|nr:BlaI/MecI/CopY family transcriptional regulator [Kofleriaceae bacterium]MBP6835930.1 BlaI/MecI/CopY family transcriptional regulator [Kofleriaceae bacterium]MBP9203025.1 BlaI/MecI/CopY family transcriptional regulator [Kofleriaceae bacterium]